LPWGQGSPDIGPFDFGRGTFALKLKETIKRTYPVGVMLLEWAACPSNGA